MQQTIDQIHADYQTADTIAEQYAAQMTTLKLASAQAWALDDAGRDATEAWAHVMAAANIADELRRTLRG